MNTQVATQPRSIGDLQSFVAGRMKQIKSVIASNVTPEKMARIALNELRNSEFLAKCAIQSPESFLNAIIQASHLGLEIGGTLGQAYLVPFKGEIKMMPGYRGLLSLARRSGEITSINAEIVYEQDEFDLSLGMEAKVTHKPKIRGNRGEPVLAYMVAHFKDGGHHFEWMSIEEIMSVKERSSAVQSAKKNGKQTPWDTDRDEMIRKTVIRRGWKYLPMSIEMQTAQVIESANEQGQSVHIESSTIEGEVVVVSNTDPVDTDVGGAGKKVPPECTAEQFAELAKEWEPIVRSGKKKAKNAIGAMSTVCKLTEEQQFQIDAWQQEGN